jgi:hypothetical protein
VLGREYLSKKADLRLINIGRELRKLKVES